VPSIKKIDKNNSVLPEKVDAILAVLDQHYPEAQCSLDFKKPLELLIATILAAQCTDARVNQVTPSLFKKYPSAKAYADARLEELESDIRSTGFYHNKAKNIQACCRILHERFGGDIPADLNALVELPGIGRKTANVILGSIYHIPGIIVDTHVGRVARRLGLTSHKDPVKIEQDLMAIIAKERWTLFSHQLVQHGRRVCHARKPACPDCPLRPFCDYFQSLE
jgi:endonuclease-3